MILVTHALTGAVLGKFISNPLLLIPASLAVHFAMDSLRHGEYFDLRKTPFKITARNVLLDLSAIFIFTALFIKIKHPDFETFRNILIGTFFSMLPDGLTLCSWIFKPSFMKPLQAFHAWSHHYKRFPKFSPERQWTLRNAANDILISSLAVLILFLL